MKIIFSLMLFCLLILNGYGQQKDIEISSESKDGVITLFAENRTNGTHTILVNFSTLVNLRVSTGAPYMFTVAPGRSRICELQRIRDDAFTNYRYSYRYYPGCIRDRADRDIPYLLPVAEGEKTRYLPAGNLGNEFAGREKPENWNGSTFFMEQGDTVYAMRRGRVVEVEESRTVNTGESYLYSRDVNFVRIEQGDCTMARYRMFAKDGIFPEEGEYVEAGDPIGIVDGSNSVSGAHVSILVYYLDSDEFLKTQPGEHPWAYLPLKFVTANGNEMLESRKEYEAVKPEEVITMEMSRRELKQYLKRE